MDIGLGEVDKFVALGGTFHTHLEEKERSYRWPDIWVVPMEGVIPEGENIQLPKRVEDVKPGSELTAVIGKELWEASEEEAWDGIKGFTVSNDITASGDWPGWSDPQNPMITGVGYKILPTFSPVLTEYQPKQSEEEYYGLDVRVEVDGEVSVKGSTGQMAFSVPEMVSFASNVIKLSENDMVALGDPGDASVYLDNADEVTCYVETVGELTNPVETV